jgi:hypothetical protein
LIGRAIQFATLAALVVALPACSDSNEIDQTRSPPGHAGTGGSGLEGGLGSGGSSGGGGAPGSGASNAGGLSNSGGAGGGSGANTGGTLPDGGVTHTTLPPRPAWNPVIPLGTPGWRKSTVPFCSEDVAGLSPRVWSNDGVVYVMVGADCNSFAHMACNYVGINSVAVYSNDGTGWRTLYHRHDVSGGAITGYADGRLVLLGGECAVTSFDRNGTPSCIWTGRSDFFGTAAVAIDSGELFVLGAYTDGSRTQELHAYDGRSWTSIKTWESDVAPGALRTDGSTVFVGGGKQYVWTFDPVQRTESEMRGVPAGEYWTSWFFGRTDFLLGNTLGGLVHYDGAKWTLLDTPVDEAFFGMWGAADKTAFVYSQGTIGRWNAGAFETLHRDYYDAGNTQYVTDVWGNSSTEVFFAVNDNAFQPYTCGATFLVWFDGTTFHQF